jgi:hypothetical protein
MALSLRWAACAAFLGLVLLGAYLLFPPGRSSGNGDDPGSTDGPRAYAAMLQRATELDQSLRARQRRLRAQDQIAHELVAGRITLAEATRRFGELPNAPEKFYELLSLGFPGNSDQERLGRLVISWACSVLEKQPDQAAFLCWRLETELADLGTVSATIP